MKIHENPWKTASEALDIAPRERELHGDLLPIDVHRHGHARLRVELPDLQPLQVIRLASSKSFKKIPSKWLETRLKRLEVAETLAKSQPKATKIHQNHEKVHEKQ